MDPRTKQAVFASAYKAFVCVLEAETDMEKVAVLEDQLPELLLKGGGSRTLAQARAMVAAMVRPKKAANQPASALEVSLHSDLLRVSEERRASVDDDWVEVSAADCEDAGACSPPVCCLQPPRMLSAGPLYAVCRLSRLSRCSPGLPVCALDR